MSQTTTPTPKIQPITPDGLLRLAAGRTVSRLLELAMEKDLFARLKGKAVPLAELAEVWQMPAPSARLVAQYLTNEGLLVYRDGAVSNGPLAEAALTGDSELRGALSLPFKYNMSLEELRHLIYDPPALQWYQLRDQGEITDDRPLYGSSQERWVKDLASQRHELRIENGRSVAERYDFSAHRKLLDLGGSSGGVGLGIRQLNPHLRCVVFDLPDATEVAREKIAEAGEQEFVEAVAGSFFTSELPAGADVALLANVLHTWEPKEDRIILRKALDALEEGGTVLVREAFFEDDWSGSVESVFDGFVLIGKEGMSGWQPTYSEMEEILREVGFVDVERRPQLVIGRKPRA